MAAVDVVRTAQACRLLQIWIEPSSRGIAPAYEQKPFAIGSGWTVLLDPDQREGAMAIHRPVRLWRGQPQPGQSLELPLAPASRGWLQMVDGAVALAGLDKASGCPAQLQRGDGLGFEAGSVGQSGLPPTITATSTGADVLLFELR